MHKAIKASTEDKNPIESLNTSVYNTIFEQLKFMEINNKLIQDIAKLSSNLTNLQLKK